LFADTVLQNGKIRTMCQESKEVTAAAIINGRIIRTGTGQEIQRYIGENTEVIDLKGKTVLPGFIDSHVHLTQTGLDLMGVDTSKYSRFDDVLSAIEALAKKTAPGNWIRCYAFKEHNYSENRMLTRFDIDKLGIPNPVFISRVDAHSCTVNTIGLQRLNIPDDIQGIDKTGNELTGILRGNANSYARKTVTDSIDDETRIEGLKLACDRALKVGITSIHAMEGGNLFNEKDVPVLVRHKDNLPVSVTVFHQVIDVDKVISEGLSRIGGCIPFDGSLGSYTAALSQPYADKPETRGILYYSDEEVEDFVLKAHTNNIQITGHAIGDRAIIQLLNAYEKALDYYPRSDCRHRVEHFSVTNDYILEKARELGIIISAQPVFDYYNQKGGNTNGKRLGELRNKNVFPFKTMADIGLVVCGGSDSSVTPMNPLLGIHSAVNHSLPEQRVSVYDAVKMFTINAAYAVFEEKERGTIEPGKWADMVILDKDIFDIPENEILGANVAATMAKGKVVYKST
jgi:predicted amidohydrolase YtcJ